MSALRRFAYLVVLLSPQLVAAKASAAPTVTFVNATGAAGANVDVAINFDPGGGAVTDMQFSLNLPVSLSTVSVTAGNVITAAGKSEADAFSNGVWTFLISGLNSNTIGLASPLVTARMKIASNASGTITVPFSNVKFSDANGNAISGSGIQGTVTVGTAGPPTITLTKTADKTNATPGTTITYAIAYRNTGTADASNVVIKDVIPTGTTFVANSITGPGNGALSGNTITWNIGTVTAGTGSSVGFQVQAQ